MSLRCVWWSRTTSFFKSNLGLLHSLSPFLAKIFPEAFYQRCFVKKVFLEISQNSQEGTCARVSATLLKKRLWHRCFPMNFAKFLRTPFFTEHLRWLLLFFKPSTYFIYHLLPSFSLIGTKDLFLKFLDFISLSVWNIRKDPDSFLLRFNFTEIDVPLKGSLVHNPYWNKNF